MSDKPAGFEFIIVAVDGKDITRGTLADLHVWLNELESADKLPDWGDSWADNDDAPAVHMYFNGSEVYQMDVEESRSFLMQLIDLG